MPTLVAKQIPVQSAAPQRDEGATTTRPWDITTLRRVQQLIRGINAGSGLQETLQAIVDGVVEVAGFEVAVLSHVQPDGLLTCVAVAGSESARQQLLGQRLPVEEYEKEFAAADDWGSLRFVPHDKMPGTVEESGWIPPLEVDDGDPGAWHPEDALFAPLYSPQGGLIGVLSVDLPQDRRRPGLFQREVLDMYAAHAGLAVYNADLVAQLRAGEEGFRLAFEATAVGMAVIRQAADMDGTYVRVNRAFCELLGYTEAELIGKTVSDITHPDDLDGLRSRIAQVFDGQRQFKLEKRYLHATGGSVWVSVTSSIVEDSDGAPAYGISQIEDISAQRAMRAELRRQATHDGLTGLANRRALFEHLEGSLAAVQRTDEASRQVAVLFCDLDDFKSVNDSWGHYVGDQVLNVVADRLRRAVREGDLVARLGGDEFVVVTRQPAVGPLSRRLSDAISAPMAVQNHQISLTMSIGVATTRERRATAQQLIHEADLAMYAVKGASPHGRLRGTSDRRTPDLRTTELRGSL